MTRVCISCFSLFDLQLDNIHPNMNPSVTLASRTDGWLGDIGLSLTYFRGG